MRYNSAWTWLPLSHFSGGVGARGKASWSWGGNTCFSISVGFDASLLTRSKILCGASALAVVYLAHILVWILLWVPWHSPCLWDTGHWSRLRILQVAGYLTIWALEHEACIFLADLALKRDWWHPASLHHDYVFTLCNLLVLQQTKTSYCKKLRLLPQLPTYFI